MKPTAGDLAWLRKLAQAAQIENAQRRATQAEPAPVKVWVDADMLLALVDEVDAGRARGEESS